MSDGINDLNTKDLYDLFSQMHNDLTGEMPEKSCHNRSTMLYWIKTHYAFCTAKKCFIPTIIWCDHYYNDNRVDKSLMM